MAGRIWTVLYQRKFSISSLSAAVVAFNAFLFTVVSTAQPTTQSRTHLRSENSAPQTTKRTSAKWKLGLHGQSFANEGRREQAESVGLGLGGKLATRLMPILDVTAEALVRLESGRAQSRFGDNVPGSGVLLREALINFRPLDEVTVSAGAIDQSHLENPLLVSDQAFPGAIERVKFGGEALSLELKAQQTIPTSVTLATRAAEGEKTPTFFTAGAVLRARPWSGSEFKLHGTAFRFQDLPSTVAVDSELHGNSTDEQGPLTSRFAYPFSGWTGGGSGSARLHRSIKVGGGAIALQNLEAPSGARNGQIIFVNADLALTSSIRLRPRAEIFFNESDSSPAYYNSSEYGHNNRKGVAFELSSLFARERFRAGLRFVDAELIDPNLHQSRQQYFMLKLETLYEKL